MSLIHYLLEANLYLAAFYLLYVLLLRSETLYQLNRAYLLVTSLLAFIIPLLQLGILKPEIKHTASVGMVSLDMSPVAVNVIPQVVAEAPKWTTVDYALALYIAITIAMLGFLLFKIAKLIALSKKGNAKRQDGFVVIEIPGDNVAFSFFGYLFVNRELSASQTVMHHEEVHIRQKHSWDVIWFELLKTFNWFNPTVYLLEKSLKEVHEFIADQQVAIAGNGAEEYADFLISNAYGITHNQLTNSFFNKNLLKRRIIMLYQKKSGRAAKLKYLLTLPLMGGLLCISTLAFTTKTYGVVDLAPKHVAVDNTHKDSADVAPKADDQSDYARGWRDAERDIKNGHSMISANKAGTFNKNLHPLDPVTNRVIKNIPGGPVFNAVEKNPTFPGGEPAFYKFLSTNVKYPKEALDNNITGRVFVQFIVEPTGALSAVKVVREPGYGLGTEALRVLKLSPKWNPGVQNGKKVRVMYTVPVNFSIADDGKKPVQTNATTKTYGDNGIINASFPGGEQAFGKFLVSHVIYPGAAKTNNVQGRVFVKFIVDVNGDLSDFAVVRDPGAGLGDEALRVMKLSPNWVPATKDGNNVRTEFTVPINFSLVDDESGDIKDLYKYVRDHIRYPRVAKEANIHGRSFVSFTLDDQKHLQNVKMVRTPDETIGNEILRVVKNFGTLTDGKPGYTYTLPINFFIDNGGDQTYKSTGAVTEGGKVGTSSSNLSVSNSSKTLMLDEIVIVGYGPVKK